MVWQGFEARPPTGRLERVDAAPAEAPRRRAGVAGRFGIAAAALCCMGTLLGAHRADGTRIYRADGTGWWLVGDVELDLWRTAVDASGGTPFVQDGRRLVRDPGFGPRPSGQEHSDVATDSLRPATLLDLVRVAGLHPVRARPLDEAILLLPGFAAAPVIRRALDLGLDVTHRMVRLHPLFDDSAGPATMIEVTLRGSTDPVPSALLAAAARAPLSLVCRPAAGALLIQHGMAAPLPDDRLASIVDSGVWVLADAAFGCWRLEPVGDRVPSTGLVRLGADFPIVTQPPAGDLGTLAPTEVRLVPAGIPGQRVDAVLLDRGDLDNVVLLLEQHPLADIAVLVPGTDRHLLLAAGGLLTDLGVGEPLACVGPGPLYVPLGRRLSPRLPPTARQSLFQPDEHHAVIILDGHGLRFHLDHRRPLWTTWAAEPPEVVTELPEQSIDTLRSLDEPPPSTPDQPVRPAPTTRTVRSRQPLAPHRTWRDDALAAELAGDLPRAAGLFRRHGEPLRAAHLYERAAREQSAQ